MRGSQKEFNLSHERITFLGASFFSIHRSRRAFSCCTALLICACSTRMSSSCWIDRKRCNSIWCCFVSEDSTNDSFYSDERIYFFITSHYSLHDEMIMIIEFSQLDQTCLARSLKNLHKLNRSICREDDKGMSLKASTFHGFFIIYYIFELIVELIKLSRSSIIEIDYSWEILFSSIVLLQLYRIRIFIYLLCAVFSDLLKKSAMRINEMKGRARTGWRNRTSALAVRWFWWIFSFILLKK